MFEAINADQLLDGHPRILKDKLFRNKLQDIYCVNYGSPDSPNQNMESSS